MWTFEPVAARSPHNVGRRRAIAASALAFAFLFGTAVDAYAQRCQPRRKFPSITLTTLGPCEFNPETFSFAGEPDQQALCLMRSATARRNLGPRLESIPAPLATRVGQSTGLPERETLAALLVELGLVWDYAPFLWQPVSRGRDNDPDAPQARYMVIHDTSSPNFGGRPFPVNIDEHRSINSLARYRCGDGWEAAHVIINRTGAMLLGHELSEPWRATRFERATRFGTVLKGLFLHVELIQPRRSQRGLGRNNDGQAPTPGFSDIQYDRLALVYTIASVRAGRWLIPAFHIAIDSGIRGGHDDPQNFEIESFAGSLERLANRLTQQRSAAEPDVTPTEAPATEMATTEAATTEELPAEVATTEVDPPAAEVAARGTDRRD